MMQSWWHWPSLFWASRRNETRGMSYEESLLRQSLNRVIFLEGHRSGDFEKHLISRRLLNVLSSAKLYLDTLPQHANRIFEHKPATVTKLKETIRGTYDKSFGYRTMEALRNYAQHRELPVHIIAWRSEKSADGRLGVSAIPKLDISLLAHDHAFKRAVLGELVRHGKLVELMPFVRDHVEGLTMIHKRFRASIRRYENKWNGVMGVALVHYMNANPSKIPRRIFKMPRRVWAVANRGNRNPEVIHVFSLGGPDASDLRRKTEKLGGLSSRYVKW
jgi:hypothetical protein